MTGTCCFPCLTLVQSQSEPKTNQVKSYEHPVATELVAFLADHAAVPVLVLTICKSPVVAKLSDQAPLGETRTDMGASADTTGSQNVAAASASVIAAERGSARQSGDHARLSQGAAPTKNQRPRTNSACGLPPSLSKSSVAAVALS